jgi:hypothetical protein
VKSLPVYEIIDSSKGLEMKRVLGTAAALIAGLIMAKSEAQSRDWTVKNSWSPAMEDKFAEFINVMGDDGCGSLNRCFKSPSANPFYVNKTPSDVSYYADCADLPFALRAYFAWMEGLPFDYVDDVVSVNGGGDIRYTKDGNRPTGYRKLNFGGVYDGPRELRNISDMVSTAMYRMHYKYVSDFYPAGINTKDIRPGTVMYDPSGHAAIIYKIDSRDGTIKMMDAHPDGSITHIRFDQKFVRSRVAHGAGFKNWRPELNYDPTSTLPDFSTERFDADYTYMGTKLDYYDYIKTVMSGGNLKIDPVIEVKAMVAELCANLHDREAAVETALKSGIQNQSHPSTLPKNIYGTSGEWEEFSTPSRDARLKTGFVTLLDETKRYFQMFQAGNGRLDYAPTPSRYSQQCATGECFLAASLLEAYEEATAAPECQFQYLKSDGTPRPLNYEEVVQRLFKMSFDPYHCVELRWGAEGRELRSCPDGASKLEWYEAEQGLRNQIERKYDDVMNYGPKDTARKLGVAQPPEVDMVDYLLAWLQ